MKRASFVIPLSGLALVGCGDPIVGSWNVTEIEGRALPYTYAYTNANGAACTATLRVQMAVDEDLTLAVIYNYVYLCDDGVQNPPAIETEAGTITVVDKKAKYNIVVDGDTLNCDMVDNVALNCIDPADAGAVVKFEVIEVPSPS
jgi:hypothetical protein